MFFCFVKHVSHFCVCPTQRPRGITVLKVKCFKEASLIGSNEWSLCQLVQHQEEFPGGDTLLSLDLSLWKISRRQERFSFCRYERVNFPCYQQWLACNRYLWKPATDFRLPNRLIWLILSEQPQFMLPLLQRSPPP